MMDVHSYCPGGTGKKIKHCACRDIAGELERIIRSVEGNQRVAALDRINRALATRANRPCLLALKITTLLDMKDMQSLEDTVTTFVKVAPDNPLAHTFNALLESRKHRVREAVDELQTALSLVQEVFPGELYDGFEEVAGALATSGEYLAARAHVMLRLNVNHEDRDAARSVVVLLNAERVPQILKRNLAFEPCPAGATWKARFDVAYRDAVTGAWRKGLEKFEKLNQDFPDQPAILHNVALARSCLALPRLPEAWHAYARCPGVEFQQAVDAEALAQLLSLESDRATVAFVKQIIHVQDANALNERLLSSKMLVPIRTDRSQYQQADDAPPPKSVFMLLDKPLTDGDTEPTADTVSRVLTHIMLFGRETDRAARVELNVPRTDALDDARARLAEIAGDLLTAEESEEILDTIGRLQLVFNPMCYFPPATPLTVRQRVHDEVVQRDLLRHWPDIPLAALDDKSPRQVMEDPVYRVPLAGALVALEQLAEVDRWPIDVNPLREQMGVPIPEPIDPQAADVASLPPADLTRVILERLTDDDLLLLYERAVVCHGRKAIVRLSEELLRRDSVADKVDRAGLHAGIAELTSDPDRAVDCLQLAQQIALEKKQSPARYLLSELPLQLVRGNPDRSKEIIRQLETRHMAEPGVSEALYNILVQFRILTPDGRLNAAPKSEETGEPESPASKLWTPDAPPAAADEKKPSQLWVPD